MKVTDTLDLRADLKTKVNSSTYTGHMREHLLLDLDVVLKEDTRDRITRQADAFIISMQQSLDAAENYFVSSDMCELVSFSSQMLDSTDLTDVRLAPSKHGFCVFEKPIELIDIRGATLLVNYIVWSTVSDGSGRLAVILHMWNDEYSHPDDAAQEMNADPAERARRMEVIGRWGYIGSLWHFDGETIGDELSDISEDIAFRYEVRGIEPHAITNVGRIVHALWLMLGQTIVRSDREEGDKRQGRSMKWMKLPNNVTVIQLRRTESKPAEGESSVEWKHRWITRGHWRWQPCKDEAGEWVRKRIWIHAFVKGPVDKPLVLTRKVNALVR